MNHFLILLTTATFLHAQGPLTPPGAPAPTMKSLDQVEARRPIPPSPDTPVSGPHFTITEPGSYYFTGNVTVTDGPGIVINANNVTLDLNGFTLACSASSALPFVAGIQAYSVEANLTITNGNISSNTVVTDSVITESGWHHGLYAGNLKTIQIRSLNITGVSGYGIHAISSIVTQCSVSNCTTGIRADVVTQSSASNCWSLAIQATTVSNSQGHSLNSSGIYATTVTGCQGSGVSVGIEAETVSNANGFAFSTSRKSSGIVCKNAINSIGTGSTHGINASENVTGCTGIAIRPNQLDGQNQYGIYCRNATASSGSSEGNRYAMGIYASGNVSDCVGKAPYPTSGSAVGLIGIQCSNASNSQGTGQNRGIRAFANATSCYGKASDTLDSVGIHVDGTASFCRGDHNLNSGVALQADIAIGCTRANGVINSPSKQLGTP